MMGSPIEAPPVGSVSVSLEAADDPIITTAFPAWQMSMAEADQDAPQQFAIRRDTLPQLLTGLDAKFQAISEFIAGIDEKFEDSLLHFKDVEGTPVPEGQLADSPAVSPLSRHLKKDASGVSLDAQRLDKSLRRSMSGFLLGLDERFQLYCGKVHDMQVDRIAKKVQVQMTAELEKQRVELLQSISDRLGTNEEAWWQDRIERLETRLNLLETCLLTNSPADAEASEAAANSNGAAMPTTGSETLQPLAARLSKLEGQVGLLCLASARERGASPKVEGRGVGASTDQDVKLWDELLRQLSGTAVPGGGVSAADRTVLGSPSTTTLAAETFKGNPAGRETAVSSPIVSPRVGLRESLAQQVSPRRGSSSPALGGVRRLSALDAYQQAPRPPLELPPRQARGSPRASPLSSPKVEPRAMPPSATSAYPEGFGKAGIAEVWPLQSRQFGSPARVIFYPPQSASHSSGLPAASPAHPAGTPVVAQAVNFSAEFRRHDRSLSPDMQRLAVTARPITAAAASSSASPLRLSASAVGRPREVPAADAQGVHVQRSSSCTKVPGAAAGTAPMALTAMRASSPRLNEHQAMVVRLQSCPQAGAPLKVPQVGRDGQPHGPVTPRLQRATLPVQGGRRSPADIRGGGSMQLPPGRANTPRVAGGSIHLSPGGSGSQLAAASPGAPLTDPTALTAAAGIHVVPPLPGSNVAVAGSHAATPATANHATPAAQSAASPPPVLGLPAHTSVRGSGPRPMERVQLSVAPMPR
eukprot:TRINITY_DN22288_c0_g2_i1.p1 TRINITY_DN22288_c0_g2~~TRINITY_DN22288_c0_g2_i1.p1  ORF type:complete len:756 (+),score=126.84 TRINITY_DN22288_c0_g2_i1:122-2389(+)